MGCNVYTIIVKLNMLNLFKMFVNKYNEKEIDFLNKKISYDCNYNFNIDSRRNLFEDEI